MKASTIYEYTDPRRLPGSPFDVAEAAALQASDVGQLLVRAIDDTYMMARSAEMERELQLSDTCDGSAFADSPLGARLLDMKESAIALVQKLKAASLAAGYNPKHPPKEIPA